MPHSLSYVATWQLTIMFSDPEQAILSGSPTCLLLERLLLPLDEAFAFPSEADLRSVSLKSLPQSQCSNL